MTFSRFRLRLPTGIAFLVATALLVMGCGDESLLAPEAEDDLFTRYVSIGNSITAGFQSGGINRQTQSESYTVLLAEQMGTSFDVPGLNLPGCPPPLVQFFDPETAAPNPQRPGNTDAATCALRDAQTPLQLNNVAVPGARVLDVLTNETNTANALTQFVLGGQTQIEAALDANPTFATVWIGNNDVLDPALNGTANVTPPEEFQSRYTNILDQLTSSNNFQAGVLIGVANVTFTPFFSPGPVYFALDQLPQQQSPFPPNFDVASNCNAQDPNTGLSPLVPLDFGFGLLGQAAQNPDQTVTLDCTAEGALSLQEVGTLVGTIQAYNTFIQNQADQRGLGYLNPNEVLGALYLNEDGDQDPTNDLIPKFPNVTDPDQPFGPFFSLDGVHPSAPTHRVVAAQLVETINAEFGTSLTPPENVPPLPTGGSQ